MKFSNEAKLLGATLFALAWGVGYLAWRGVTWPVRAVWKRLPGA